MSGGRAVPCVWTRAVISVSAGRGDAPRRQGPPLGRAVGAGEVAVLRVWANLYGVRTGSGGDRKIYGASAGGGSVGPLLLRTPVAAARRISSLVGVPVPDATQWDQGEIVGDCTHPLFKCIEKLAAQGEVIFQDDTPGRMLTLIAENQQARAQARAQGKAKPDTRTGMYTTALIVQVGERRICLYSTGRRHAGEKLEALLPQREPGRDKPLVMSDALSHNNAEKTNLIRCHCLAHGRRQFTVLADDVPAGSAVVAEALKLGYDHDQQAHEQLSAQERVNV